MYVRKVAVVIAAALVATACGNGEGTTPEPAPSTSAPAEGDTGSADDDAQAAGYGRPAAGDGSVSPIGPAALPSDTSLLGFLDDGPTRTAALYWFGAVEAHGLEASATQADPPADEGGSWHAFALYDIPGIDAARVTVTIFGYGDAAAAAAGYDVGSRDRSGHPAYPGDDTTAGTDGAWLLTDDRLDTVGDQRIAMVRRVTDGADYALTLVGVYALQGTLVVEASVAHPGNEVAVSADLLAAIVARATA